MGKGLKINLIFSFWVFLLTLCSFKLQAQETVITGSLSEIDHGSPAVGVNILAKDPTDSTTVSFAFSDGKGKFKLLIDHTSDSLLLFFRSMTIEELVQKVPNQNQDLNLKVFPATLELQEVVKEGLKNPISFQNDTLSYDIEALSNRNDRVLGDVLKRLPGIEVDASGMIRYQGRPLIKFYIEGLDLLGGKYNLANNNMPVDAVASVQVLENHQPIRVLDSLVYSDRAAINIKLKKKNVWIGTAKVGTGLPLWLWDAKFSPMLFGNDFQMLNVLESNNVGRSMENELKVLTLDEFRSKEKQEEFGPWVGAPYLEFSGLERRRNIFNKSFLGSVNALKKISATEEMKTNISFQRENIENIYQIGTTFFVPNDTISFIEDNRFLDRISALKAEATYTNNSRKKYLQNAFHVDIRKSETIGATIFNDSLRQQNADVPLFEIGNKLKGILPVNRKLINVESNISFRHSDQNLLIRPGLYQELLNNGDPYAGLNQGLTHRAFYALNSFGFTRRISKGWSMANTMGIKNRLDQVNSQLYKRLEDSEQQPVIGNFFNRIRHLETKPFIRTSLDRKSPKFNFSFDLPISYLHLRSEDSLLDFDQQVSKVLLEPLISTTYRPSGKFTNSLSISRKNEFRNIYDLHAGVILRDFRNFQQKATSIPKLVNHSLNYYLQFKDPIKVWFVDFRYSAMWSQLNTMMASEVLEGGEVILTALDLDNRQRNHILNGSINKYIPEIFLGITLKQAFTFMTFQQLINESLSTIKLQQYLPGIDLNFSPKTNIALRLDLQYGDIRNSISGEEIARIGQFRTKGSLDFFPIKNHLLRLEASFFQNSNRVNEAIEQAFFLDFLYRHTIPWRKVDIELRAENLLNENAFGTFNTGDFSLISQEIILRPRQIVISISFPL